MWQRKASKEVTFAGELSHNDIRELLRTAIKAPNSKTYCYIRDVYSDYFVYSEENYDSGESKLYQRSYSIDSASYAVTLGEEVEVVEQTNYVPVAVAMSDSFDGEATFSADGDFVERSGIIFKLGDYPEKGFTLNQTEADAAVAAFNPTDNELEHFDTEGRKSILSGKLGQLSKVWRDGEFIKGTMRVPTWIDQVWGDAGRKVSVVWNRATKQLSRNGLVVKPHVSEAAAYSAEDTVLAAFAAFNSGQQPAGSITAPTGDNSMADNENANAEAIAAANRRAEAAFGAAARVMAASSVNALITGRVIKPEVKADLLTLAAVFAEHDMNAIGAGNPNVVAFSDGKQGTFLDLMTQVITQIVGPGGHGLDKDGVQVHFSAPAPGSGGGSDDDDAELAALRQGAATYAATLNGANGQQ